ncbi:MAG: hypothetical protein WAL56_24695 [Candidatus Sulfotelmatobacter sp.]
MYTGTLISDLMAVVERVEQSVQQKRMFRDREVERQIFETETFQQAEEIFAGAA